MKGRSEAPGCKCGRKFGLGTHLVASGAQGWDVLPEVAKGCAETMDQEYRFPTPCRLRVSYCKL